jgi:hypothetical protein
LVARWGSVAKPVCVCDLDAGTLAAGGVMNEFKNRHFLGEIVLWAVRGFC